MDKQALVKFCKELGCCDACCLRYLGIKNPAAYENTKEFILKYQDEDTDKQTHAEGSPGEHKTEETDTGAAEGAKELNGSSSPPPKRKKADLCISCLGILQESSWPQCLDAVKEQLDKKRYECRTFGCALSAPIATILRERAVTLYIAEKFPDYDTNSLTALKEAWKWSFGSTLAAHIDMTLTSGAVAPLLITVTMQYEDDLQELEILKTLSPSLFESRSRQKRRFAVEFTRRCVEQALEGATAEKVRLAGWRGDVGGIVTCTVGIEHVPVYLGGRYIKLSRELPQSPWVLNGRRMMEGSVQETIFQPIAKLYGMTVEESEHRLKFMSAGREDVDVRCLGEGRPFAVEITDPHRELTSEELQTACEDIAKSGSVQVKLLMHVTKDDLTQLKKGEESKTKTYEALCIKLSHSAHDTHTEDPPIVTETDIANISSYRNTPPEGAARVALAQRTPIRVLHRRPLLTRSRHLYQLSAHAVAGHPQLFIVRVRTEAGTYMKEWCHGELGRTQPSLATAVGARVDILALDVAGVDLDWPIIKI